MANLTRIKNNQITDSTITNVKIAAATLTGDLMNPQLTFNSNLVLNGNLTVSGNFTAVQSTTTQITDPLITLGMGNPGVSYDLGTVLTRGSGGNRFMGWKENAGAFVFINTTEDGTTTGNIATTAYSNVVVGNLITIGATTHSDITLSGNTVSARGALTLVSGSGATTFPNAVVLSSTLSVGSTVSVGGTATVNELISNGAIQGTSIGSSGTATFASVVSNGAIQGTTIGGSGTATFASVVSNGAIQGTTLNGSANATVNALTVNNSATMTTLGVSGNIAGGNLSISGAASVGTLTIDGGLQNTPVGNATPNTGNFTTLTAGTSFNTSGTATVNAVISNGAIQGTTISGSGVGTFASVVSNGAIQGTTIGGSGNATVSGLTVNNSATVGTTLSALAGIQSTPIGNVTAASGAFTTLNATGAITGASTLTTTGAATVNALTSNTSITGATMSITGNAVIGNLSVTGNLSYINSQTLIVQDPIIELNTGPNGAPLTTDNNFDVGVRAHFYDTADRSAFFGYKDSSGYFEYYSNVTSETGNVIVGTYGTIKTGNLQLTGLASVGTTLSVAGNATVNALTVNNSATIDGALGVTGNLISGNLSTTNINATNAVFTNNVTIEGTLTATSNVVANTSGIFFGNAETGLGAIYAGLPTYTILPNVVAQFTTNINNYAQINAQNLNSGSGASTDLVLTANDGTDSLYFIDLGIGSNNYAYSGFASYAPHDGYLLVNGGNLLLNTDTAGKSIKFIVGGTGTSDVIAELSTTRFIVSATTASTNSTDGAIVALGGLGVAGAINGGSTLNVTGTATVNALVSNGAIQGTTVGASGNATIAALTVNGSATVGTTLSATAGIQATPIGNVTASSGAFTTLTSSGLTTVTNSTDSTGTTTGALVVTGGLGIGAALNVGTTATLGNITHSNLTISSNLTNTGITINPNGTGETTINSGLNNSRTVINGTQANVFVVSGSQVGANVNTFVSGATFQVGSKDSILLPVGAQGDRPASPSAGMFRYSTTAGAIEWYDGATWQTAGSQFTIAVANTQTGNGSATIFSLPVANATTAGTIVSINGIVQQPTSAYSVTGANVTFTEAPSSTDVIDFRVLTTSTSVTSIVDTAGTTGLFLDTPVVGNQIITFKTNGSESLSIQSNTAVIVAGDILPSGNATANIGSVGRQFNTIFAKATSAQYADLAENYAADAVYEPGTVVHFGGPEEIQLCNEDMCQRVAGVVSTNPAYIMNAGQTGIATAVALQGRVPTKVIGPVRKGDMMVSAGNGAARADSNPKIGSVIGKALENFDGLEGVIEVVVGRL